jgi:thioester reductase-like protein
VNIALARSANARSVIRTMRRDAVLPDDAVPEAATSTGADGTLVTGATGFLGRYLLRELLQKPGGPIYCLVRATSQAAAHERVAMSLRAVGIDLDAHAERIKVLPGATDAPLLGLSEKDYRHLATQVSVIQHCAASVNWAVGYQWLRASNVLGTLGLIRFACAGTLKRIYYSSSLAVCFSVNGPRVVDESTNMLPFLQHMPLAYAQSKCVAESLLRAAAVRGVPVSVVRPTLISGDSVTGVSNPGDLISALLQGCVTAGAALDRDWQLDCVPVDHVARVLSQLSTSQRPDWEVLHLANHQGRHWREVVLWMNLYGYPVELVPHAEWLQRVFARDTAPGSLFGYRSFFGAGKRVTAPAPYEAYLEDAQRRVCNEQSQATLAALNITVPPLTADLLEHYVAHYVRSGILPAARRCIASVSVRDTTDGILRAAIEGPLAARGLRLLEARERPFTSTNGIFNEICSARLGGQIGIRRYEVFVNHQGAPLQTPRQPLDVLLKSKPSDTLMQELLVEVATLCDPALGAHFHTFRSDLGLSHCHERELALYEAPEPRLRALMPTTLGTHRDAVRDIWSVAMAYLPEAAAVDMGALAGSWTVAQIGTVLREIAQAHAVWYRKERQLSALPWLPPPLPTARMIEMAPLWLALAEHSSVYFSAWSEQPLLPLQRALIAHLDDWWPTLRALPQTLVHNDFNPRNFVLHRQPTGPSPLSVFDWELAAVDVPQHDFAELLCFVLPADCDAATLARLLETHRQALQEAAGVPVDRQQWLQGFRLSLRYLLINRLPLYTLIHRFKPQAFLPQVIRNWQRLCTLSEASGRQRAPETGGKPTQQNQYSHAEQVLRPNL